MIPSIRKKYNQSFSNNTYEQFLQKLHAHFPGQIEFRVAETPVFVPKDFKNIMLDTCDFIIDYIKSPAFNQQSAKAIPAHLKVPGKEKWPEFIAFDFGICQNAAGELEPQLIEMQGFPSLFGYEIINDQEIRNHFSIPANFSGYLSDMDQTSYINLLKKIILNGNDPANVILLELFPQKQKTRIDFYCTQKYIGIKPVCLTELIVEGKELFYLNEGVKTKINRVYNRIIFDELEQQPQEIKELGKILFQELDISWCPHPNWFYRISKYTLPFLHHPNIPATYFLHEIKQLPTDLENYVLKPLFSFAGQGVIIDLTLADIEKIQDPENWILQKKVNYSPAIETPDTGAKAEIRLFYFWEPGTERPIPVNNLGRLSKGQMIGVRYNQDKEWVGGSRAFFEI
jgi:hypothetical protein